MNVESFFGLAREPFSIAPDPRFLYPAEQHREALELLNYGLARGASFVLLTGEIGAGKTTLWRSFLEQLPSNVDVASVVNPKLGVDALIARVFEDLHVELPAADGPVDMIDALHGHLLLAHAQGRRTLIVIDEAQALSHEVLEQLRLLTNLDSSGRKLQVLLIGQPELREMLARPELEPLAQRIVVRFHLGALSETQTAAYIEHRLAVAGYEGALPFDGESLGLVQRFSGGVPRRINVLCDRALAIAAETGTRRIGREILERAAHDVAGPPVLPAARHAPAPALAPAPAAAGGTATTWAFGAGVAAAIAGGLLLAPAWRDPAPAPKPVVAAAPVPAPASAAPVAIAAASQASAPETAPAVEAAASAPAPSWFTPLAADEALAWRALARLWGATPAAGEPCAALAATGLSCWSGRVGLPTLRQLDRPGLLHLIDERGRSAHVLLVGLSEDSATLQLGEHRERVPLLTLARWWRGDFATLWKPPAAADTLARRLHALDGEPAEDADAASIARRVSNFQRARGLAVDGIAGPQTQMLLARAERRGEPRLGD
ncbi:general secretion pathway protein A [Rubrivivax gelatinosus]|uniref:ExeA family protein n=2 Tax=Rubrivivax gelatinosus TaxID=28068 RepID=UPI0018C91A8F|nr:ExeA family protein [Rubrivivax gelatinosus]MBG6080962.1 general secretion pathway protein A [Rubrivivax gelatinosus]